MHTQKNSFWSVGILSLTLLFLASCEQPQQFALKGDNHILSFAVAYLAEPTKSYGPLIQNNETGEIQVRVPALAGTSLASMRVLVSIPAGAVVVPAFKGNMDLSKPYRFKVIAENGDEKSYLLLVYN